MMDDQTTPPSDSIPIPTPRVLLEHDRAVILCGDSTRLGDVLDDCSVDAMVTDPPAAISFMGKSWDDDKGGFEQWTRWLADLLGASFRALKPGAHGLIWALPRTSHWTARAAELAGFEVRDIVMHLFGSGFPKSLNISKAIDDHLGTTDQRAKVGEGRGRTGAAVEGHADVHGDDVYEWPGTFDVTTAGSPEAAAWDGWGTALKPAAEHWILVRKPMGAATRDAAGAIVDLGKTTYAANVLEWGTGAINVDGCRIGQAQGDDYGRSAANAKGMINAHAGVANEGKSFAIAERDGDYAHAAGRWPAHLVLSHDEECEEVGTTTTTIPGKSCRGGDACRCSNDVLGATKHPPRTDVEMSDTTIEVPAFRCVPECPVRMLDEQSGAETGSNGGDVQSGDVGFKGGGKKSGRAVAKSKGGASRFFYVAKAPRKEKDAGLAHLQPKTGGEATGRVDGSAGTKNPRAGAGRTGGARNYHPTVKSIALMRWLVRLITPSGGTVLDPFAGSGTTGVAALAEGASFVGCELGGGDADAGTEGEYLPILVGRIRHALGLPPEAPEVTLENAGIRVNGHTRECPGAMVHGGEAYHCAPKCPKGDREPTSEQVTQLQGLLIDALATDMPRAWAEIAVKGPHHDALASLAGFDALASISAPPSE